MRFRTGSARGHNCKRELDPVADRMNRVLLEGAILGEDKAVATFCENVLALEAALWTFVTTEGRGADEQLHGAAVAPGGVVAQAEFRLRGAKRAAASWSGS